MALGRACWKSVRGLVLVLGGQKRRALTAIAFQISIDLSVSRPPSSSLFSSSQQQQQQRQEYLRAKAIVHENLGWQATHCNAAGVGGNNRANVLANYSYPSPVHANRLIVPPAGGPPSGIAPMTMNAWLALSDAERRRQLKKLNKMLGPSFEEMDFTREHHRQQQHNHHQANKQHRQPQHQTAERSKTTNADSKIARG